MQLTKLLREGVIAGAAAGLCAALVLWLVVEPVIRRALVVEESRDAGHGHAEEPLVSRALQVVFGGLTAAVVGVLVGIVFAVVFAKSRHRLPGVGDLGRATVLAGTGFTVVVLLPALKIPANPPAVGDPGTVGERTLLYLLTVLLGVLAAGAVLALDRRLVGRQVAGPSRALVAAAVAVGCVVAILLLVPDSPDGVPADVPPTLLWDFRVASLAQLAVMWLVLGLVFGARVESRARRSRPVPASL